ncbi:MAG: type II toxin-antitoxin system VapC family toxin [SAR202 cluster bacterium]|nr:type II toxin-antitoxin system VapC family toxin [SAR202 cluster bacterium]
MAVRGPWVLDASVALKWYLRDEDHLGKADLFFTAFSAGLVEIIAPTIIRHEVANGLVVASRRGRLSPNNAGSMYSNFSRLGIGSAGEDEDIILNAMRISWDFSITFYDTLYLALADQNSCNFVTADHRLYNQAKDVAQWMVWIGDVT